jgi:hypothetical protein
MLDPTNDSELYALLRIIDGTDFPYTKGLRSFPTATDANDVGLHRACLALERRGLIRRHYEENGFDLIGWMPVDPAATD